MVVLLGFAAEVVGRMLDPITLAIAVGFGVWAGRATRRNYWPIVLCGTALMTLGVLLLSALLAKAAQAPMRFYVLQSAAASFLQIWIVGTIVRRWQKKPDPAGV